MTTTNASDLTTTLKIDATSSKYEGSDDCLQLAVDEHVAAHPDLAGWDLSPRWEDDQRDVILLDVPTWSTAYAYYAVCNVNGPISVRLAGETRAEALAAFATLDGRGAIDSASTDAEDDLNIEDASEMDEDDFGAALERVGAEQIADLSPIDNAHAGTSAHLADGWTLWAVRS